MGLEAPPHQDLTNDPANIARLVEMFTHQTLDDQTLDHVVLETTRGYEWPLVAALFGSRLPLVVINRRLARDFDLAIGRLAKTDRIDATTLALFAQKVRPPLRPLPDEEDADHPQRHVPRPMTLE